MEGKVCPFFRATKDKEDIQKCLKKACAWWDMHYNCCAILSSAILLEVLAKREKRNLKIYEEKS